MAYNSKDLFLFTSLWGQLMGAGWSRMALAWIPLTALEKASLGTFSQWCQGSKRTRGNTSVLFRASTCIMTACLLQASLRWKQDTWPSPKARDGLTDSISLVKGTAKWQGQRRGRERGPSMQSICYVHWKENYFRNKHWPQRQSLAILQRTLYSWNTYN